MADEKIIKETIIKEVPAPVDVAPILASIKQNSTAIKEMQAIVVGQLTNSDDAIASIKGEFVKIDELRQGIDSINVTVSKIPTDVAESEVAAGDNTSVIDAINQLKATLVSQLQGLEGNTGEPETQDLSLLTGVLSVINTQIGVLMATSTDTNSAIKSLPSFAPERLESLIVSSQASTSAVSAKCDEILNAVQEIRNIL